MNILFICKHNRFRSKVAETFLKKYSKNNNTIVRSSGVVLDMMHPFVPSTVLELMRGRHVPIEDERAHTITRHLLNWAEKIVIVADNVEPGMFPKEKVELWPVKDCSETDVLTTNKTIDAIDMRVKEFAQRLNL